MATWYWCPVVARRLQETKVKVVLLFISSQQFVVGHGSCLSFHQMRNLNYRKVVVLATMISHQQQGETYLLAS